MSDWGYSLLFSSSVLASARKKEIYLLSSPGFEALLERDVKILNFLLITPFRHEGRSG
jgi:hypothetical protein